MIGNITFWVKGLICISTLVTCVANITGTYVYKKSVKMGHLLEIANIREFESQLPYLAATIIALSVIPVARIWLSGLEFYLAISLVALFVTAIGEMAVIIYDDDYYHRIDNEYNPAVTKLRGTLNSIAVLYILTYF